MDIDIDMNLDPRLREISQAAVAPAPPLVPPVIPSPASTLRLFPPPLFSRQTIPQGYKCVPLLVCQLLQLAYLRTASKQIRRQCYR